MHTRNNPSLFHHCHICVFGQIVASCCYYIPSSLSLTFVIDCSQAHIDSFNSFTNLSFHIIDLVVLHPSFNYMQR